MVENTILASDDIAIVLTIADGVALYKLCLTNLIGPTSLLRNQRGTLKRKMEM